MRLIEQVTEPSWICENARKSTEEEGPLREQNLALTRLGAAASARFISPPTGPISRTSSKFESHDEGLLNAITPILSVVGLAYSLPAPKEKAPRIFDAPINTCGKRTSIRVGDGDPHQHFLHMQVTNPLACTNGACSLNHANEHTITSSISGGIGGWVSGGFSVQESYTTGEAQDCDGGPGDVICVWVSLAHTAYTVKDYDPGLGHGCLKDGKPRVVKSPNKGFVGSAYYCGWSGPGNPLNPSRRAGGPHAGLGLTKPILISRKKNTHGIGKKVHDHTNQWWLRGFEAALSGIANDGTASPATSTSEENSNNGNNGMRSELYKFFVKGEGMKGTIGTRVDAGSEAHGTKRKRDESTLEHEDRDSKKEKKEKKRRKKAALEDDGRADTSERIRREKKQRKSKEEFKGSSTSEVESRTKRSEKKSKNRRNENVSAEPLETGMASKEPCVANAQLSEEDTKRKRKELKKTKKEARNASVEATRTSGSRKKRKKKEDQEEGI
ncbi:predicted protein [Uncinocarpus reesii 1704]|uniref:Uncharacterized protein n=1 Tax=Uncinocarpus reesii (strain UAMH 1704) TaxID=336963 RepID=C4JY41_UNCRE|nr:uncharacterized protein UREG_07092 [Uncinocarpus reesii 1704]EEP82227.1 predicted protein [Uncinocarpus reesii 1704]